MFAQHERSPSKSARDRHRYLGILFTVTVAYGAQQALRAGRQTSPNPGTASFDLGHPSNRN